MSKKNSDFVKVGSMLLSEEPDHNGKPAYYIKLDKNVKILINGRELAKDTFKVERPTDKFDRMVKAGKMSPDEHAKNLELYAEGGARDFVKFEIEAKLK